MQIEQDQYYVIQHQGGDHKIVAGPFWDHNIAREYRENRERHSLSTTSFEIKTNRVTLTLE